MGIEEELARRLQLWEHLRTIAPKGVASTTVIDQAGIRRARTGHGVFRDHQRTSHLHRDGVTLTLLDTGSVYADAFDDDAGEYHYPATARGSRDESEIEATKNASRFGLPIFVVLGGPSPHLRHVKMGWVGSWDDERRVFLISFLRPEANCDRFADRPFLLVSGPRERRIAAITTRPGQARFRYFVLNRCNGECAVCGLCIDPLLDAAHLCTVESGGSDDPRNGLCLCKNHHRAFDLPLNLFGIEPSSLELVPHSGYSLADLGITRPRLLQEHAPHRDALNWRWREFQRAVVE